eukprot:3522008-Pyramimonas_sp.AAC.1
MLRATAKIKHAADIAHVDKPSPSHPSLMFPPLFPPPTVIRSPLPPPSSPVFSLASMISFSLCHDIAVATTK